MTDTQLRIVSVTNRPARKEKGNQLYFPSWIFLSQRDLPFFVFSDSLRVCAKGQRIRSQPNHMKWRCVESRRGCGSLCLCPPHYDCGQELKCFSICPDIGCCGRFFVTRDATDCSVFFWSLSPGVHECHNIKDLFRNSVHSRARCVEKSSIREFKQRRLTFKLQMLFQTSEITFWSLDFHSYVTQKISNDFIWNLYQVNFRCSSVNLL